MFGEFPHAKNLRLAYKWARVNDLGEGIRNRSVYELTFTPVNRHIVMWVQQHPFSPSATQANREF